MGPQLISCGTDSPLTRMRVKSISFNGAAADQLRNATPAIRVRDSDSNASMGPQLISCGTQAAIDSLTYSTSLQWGRS